MRSIPPARALSWLMVLAACSGGQRAPRPAARASQRGAPCPQDISCPDSMRCLTLTTPDGSHADACEHPCRADDDCPAGLGCATVPDRPSKVCR